MVLCLRVSVLERVLGCGGLENCRDVTRLELTGGLAFGVIESLFSNQAASSPACEPLNEECSLSEPSLSQWRGSTFSSAAVCCRIQSSVSPRAGSSLLARLTRIAASDEPCCSPEGTVRYGAGRKKGVSSSRRWMGEPSDGSLPEPCRRKSAAASALG